MREKEKSRKKRKTMKNGNENGEIKLSEIKLFAYKVSLNKSIEKIIEIPAKDNEIKQKNMITMCKG